MPEPTPVARPDLHGSDPARRARLRRQMGCALAAGLLLLGLVLCEVLLRVLAPASPTVDHGLYLDDPDPDLRWRLRPGVRYTGGNGEEVAVNSHGLRDPERPREKPPGVRRVLVLGDSFTFGSAVGQEEPYSRRLEGLLGPGVQVVNGGVPRYSTVQEARWLVVHGLLWEPDALVLGFFVGNDPWENLTGTRGQDLRVEDGELVDRPKAERSRWRRLRNQSHLYRLLKDLPSLVGDRLRGVTSLERKYRDHEADRMAVCLRQEPASWVEAWARTREALLGIRAAAGDRPIVLLAIPDEFQVDAALRQAVCAQAGRPEADFDLDRPQRRLADLARELGFELVDPLPELRALTVAGRRLYVPCDSHWNGEGHRVAAEALARSTPLTALRSTR